MLINIYTIYTAKSGNLSIIAVVTTAITGTSYLASSLLAIWYKLFKLKRVEKEDAAEMRSCALLLTSSHSQCNTENVL
jgi:hypothetical protein